MRELDGVGREHEEFKLRLEKEKQIELSAISAQQQIAHNQASVLSEALKAAKIDIVGGDGDFFKQISSAVRGGKTLDSFVNSSTVATDVKNTFFNGDPGHFRTSVQQLLDQFGVGSEDVRNLSIAALVASYLLTKVRRAFNRN